MTQIVSHIMVRKVKSETDTSVVSQGLSLCNLCDSDRFSLPVAKTQNWGRQETSLLFCVQLESKLFLFGLIGPFLFSTS